MNNAKLKSVYAPYIEKFVALKRSLGFKYLNEEIILSRFDKFAEESKVTEIGISKELSDNWLTKMNNESEQSRVMRCATFKLFCEYLNDLGIRSYTPQTPLYRHAYIPHIYTQDEISSIFKAADMLCNTYQRKDSVIFSMPCLIRLLYATGLRIKEAMALRNKDVNLIDNFIFVQDCKNETERIIPFSESLASVCKEYLFYKEKLPIKNRKQEDIFFVSLNGNDLIYMSVGVYFRKILATAGIPYVGKHHGPRIHDLRHTFACHALKSMAESGVDLYYSLPVLSTYLGHRTLESTEQYVRLTAEIYPDLIKNVNDVYLNVLPQLYDHE